MNRVLKILKYEGNLHDRTIEGTYGGHRIILSMFSENEYEEAENELFIGKDIPVKIGVQFAKLYTERYLEKPYFQPIQGGPYIQIKGEVIEIQDEFLILRVNGIGDIDVFFDGALNVKIGELSVFEGELFCEAI